MNIFVQATGGTIKDNTVGGAVRKRARESWKGNLSFD